MKAFKLFTPNFISKTPAQTIVLISLIQFLIAFFFLQTNGNPVIPKPLGVIQEVWSIIWTSGFTDNFLSTLFFIIEGMSVSIIISLAICYLFKIEALKGIGDMIAEFRFLSYTGIAFVLTVSLHDSGRIKLWVLVLCVVPYFITSLLSYFKSIDDKEYQLCYTLKMNQWQTLYEVVIKGKLHIVMEVIRQNFAYAWSMICFAESLYWAGGGLGTMLITENKHFRMERVFAILLIIMVVGLFFDYLFGVLTCFFFPYTNPTRHSTLWLVRLGSFNQFVK